jgi:hypothetical protein
MSADFLPQVCERCERDRVDAGRKCWCGAKWSEMLNAPESTEPAIPGLESVRETEHPDPGPVAPVPPQTFNLTAPPETEPETLDLFRSTDL